MSGNWGSENFVGSKTPELLEQLIAEFPPKLKQAMYAAANTGNINRGTWNHCALNAAGKDEMFGKQVSSVQAASRTFGITVAQANNFIKMWDMREGTDEECTTWLKNTILDIGLFSEPGKLMPRIVKKRVFTSEETRLKEEFDKLVENLEVPDTDVAFEFLFSGPELQETNA